MKQKRIEIQARDRRILEFVFKFRAATYGQIKQRFFPAQHESTSRNRINALCKAGYLKSLSIEKNGFQMKCVTPLPKCWSEIANSWDYNVSNPLYGSESIEHDLRLVDIIHKFEGLKWFNKYFSENLLQSSSDLSRDPAFYDVALLQPDGILKLKHTDGTSLMYAFEYEITKKAPDRYQKKIESYYKARGIDGVLYICGNQEIFDCIARTDKELHRETTSCVFSATENSVLRSKDLIKFHASDGQTIGIY